MEYVALVLLNDFQLKIIIRHLIVFTVQFTFNCLSSSICDDRLWVYNFRLLSCFYIYVSCDNVVSGNSYSLPNFLFFFLAETGL